MRSEIPARDARLRASNRGFTGAPKVAAPGAASCNEAGGVGQSGRAHGIGFWHSVDVLKHNTVTHYIWGLRAQQALAVAYEP